MNRVVSIAVSLQELSAVRQFHTQELRIYRSGKAHHGLKNKPQCTARTDRQYLQHQSQNLRVDSDAQGDSRVH